MKTFEDLDAFQRAVELSVSIYQATASFPSEERYGLTAQLRRALSVVSHVAEGQGRLTLGQWRQFLSQARGSLYEVQAQITVAQALGLIDYVRRREKPTTDN